jgi:hypothetical protein
MEELIKRIENTIFSEPQSPWKKVGEWAIGGMRAIGFSECSQYIIVETSDGRGLFDCKTGEKILRDRSGYKDRELELLCDGFGPIEGKVIRMSGIHGGGLPLYTNDGWAIEIISSWPKTEILLVEAGSWLHGKKYGKPYHFQKIWAGYEIRGCGFSYSGETLCIGESSDLVIYSRNRS